MVQPITISKNNPAFPGYLNFTVLREEGVKHIESLAGKLWTDYNIHDPGITILEVLCYAITDLGYRTNFDIQDLLARNPDESKTAGYLPDNNFFTAAEILSCNPLTEMDLRKRLLDISGVKNAWFKIADEAELPVYVNCSVSKLQLEPTPLRANETPVRLRLKGIYNVYLDLEPARATDACGNQITSDEAIIDEVKKVLQKHRNLCEDYLNIVVLGEEQIGICSDIELASNADPEDVLVAVYTQLYEFLSPPLHFYTLQELLAKGRTIEQIFEGRPLNDESFGFIDVEDLKKLEIKTILHASDFYQLIMKVPGVKAIKKLHFNNYINDLPQSGGDKWCLKMTPNYKPVFSIEESTITFYKGALPFIANAQEVKRRFEEKRAATGKVKLSGYQLDLPVPSGNYQDLADYTSIVHEFPNTYGVGESGLPDNASLKRKGLANQLKAYLLFFDQLLANYLSQLSNLRGIFSMELDNKTEKLRSYFTQPLTGISNADGIIKNYNYCGNKQDAAYFKDDPLDYKDFLNFITEDQNSYYERRSRLLDHLLARFSEQFTDYALLMFDLNGKKQDAKTIIDDKTDFLKQYPEISRNRGKGFDYTDSTRIWNTDNVPGLNKRVSKLMGVDDFNRRTLSPCIITRLNKEFYFELKNLKGAPLLKSRSGYPTEESARDAYDLLLVLAREPANYRKIAYDNFKQYGFSISDKDGNEIVTTTVAYIQDSDRDNDQANTLNYFKNVFDGTVSAIVTVKKGRVYHYRLSLSISSAKGVNNQPGVVSLLSKKSYVKEEAALVAARALLADNNFLLLANDDNRYTASAKAGFQRFGFGVSNENSEMLAVYPEEMNLFLNASDRDVHMMELLADIKNNRLNCTITPATQCYFFELYNADKSIIFLQGLTGYPSKAAAEKAYTDFVTIAKETANYSKFSNPEGTMHGFNIVLNNETVAIHPITYETTGERDNRIETMTYYLSGPITKPDAIKTNTAFLFEIKDEAGSNTWLQSAGHFPDNASATIAFNDFLTIATTLNNYRSLNHERGDRRFGFEIVDTSGKPVALHPYTYATRLERKLARLHTFYYLNQSQVLYNTPASGDAFTFELVDIEKSKWLISENVYPDASQAEAAFRDTFLPLAKSAAHYAKQDDQVNCKFTFVVTDTEQKIIARYPDSFDNEAERDMAMRFLLNYLNPQRPVPLFFEKEIDFTFQLLSSTGAVYFVATDVFPDKEETLKAFEIFLELAKDKSNYVLVEKTGLGSSFGLTLKDKMERVVATHPGYYATLKERAATIEKILYYVSNFATVKEFILKEGSYFFELPDKNNQLIFSGTQNYSSGNEALSAFKHFLSLAITERHYRLLNNQSATCAYSFELADESGKTIALHPKWYASDTERDASVRNVISFIDKPAFAILLKYNYYTFYIKDEAGFVVLESVERYQDSLTAHKAYNAFLKFTSEITSYKIIVTAGKMFGFTLVNDKGQILATHPRFYKEEAAARNIILRTINYIKAARAVETIDYKPASYRFTLKDPFGNPLLEGFEQFPTEVAALEAYSSMLLLAGDKEHFRLFDDEQNNEPYYGFELLDKQMEVLATHPHTYHSQGERDAVINFIKQYVDPKPVTWNIAATEDKLYYFELKDSTGEQVLFLGKAFYNDKENAEAAYADFLELALHDANYHLLDDARDCRYGLELLNIDKELVASHPTFYESPGERNQVKKNIIQYLRAAVTPLYEISTDPAIYTYDLSDKDGSPLFKSKASYNDEDSVKQALKQFLQLVVDRLYYLATPIESNPGMFRLELVNAAGETIAVNPNDYPDKTTCEAEADSIFKKVSTSPLNGKVEEHEPYYTFELLDANGKTILAAKTQYTDSLGNDDKKFTTSEEALASYESMRRLARESKNYEFIYRNDLCKATVTVDDMPVHGFLLTDEKGVVVAKHDMLYSSRKMRDDVIQKTVEYVDKHLMEQEDALLEKYISGTDCAYHITITDTELGTILLTGMNKYPSQIRAWPACLAILDSVAKKANYKAIVKNEKQGIGIADDQGIIIAEHPQLFDDPLERDLQVSILYWLINKPGIEYELLPFEEGYTFKISDPDNEKVILLESSITYTDSAAALKGYQAAISLAQQNINFHIFQNADATFGVELHNDDGIRVALHPAAYATENQAALATKSLLQYLLESQPAVNPVIVATAEGYTYRFAGTGTDQAAVLTGTGPQIHRNEDSAWDACNDVVELAQDGSNFRCITEEWPCDTFRYRAALFNASNEVIGLSDKFYKTRKSFDEAILDITDRLNNKNEGLHLVEHLLLRPKTRALVPAYYVQFKESNDVLLTGIYNYTDKDLAGEACKQITRLASDKNNYNTKDNPGKCPFGFELVDSTKKILAKPPLFYATAGERDEAILSIVAKFAGNGMEPATPITCEIKDIREESAPGGTDDALLKITVTDENCNDPEEDKCWASMDPYSCWITVVLPYWPQRFHNINFRRFFENVLREETPAHVALRICWVSIKQMAAFEKYYKNWLTDTAVSYADYTPCTLSDSHAGLCKILYELKNVYPKANLFDCENGSQGNIFVLNQTMLGTSNSSENGNN